MIKKFAKSTGDVIKKSVAKTGNFVSDKIEEAGYEKSALWVREASVGIGHATGASVELTGQLAEGAVKTVKGQVNQDYNTRGEGVDDLVDAGKRVGKSALHIVKYGATSAYETASGLVTKDYDRVKDGAWKLSQLAAVSLVAVSVVDILDGPDAAVASEIDTINAGLEGDVHPVTGVPFERTEIEYNGQLISDVFPVFESEFTATLTEQQYLLSDSTHFNIANEQLYNEIQQNPALAQSLNLSSEDIVNLQYNITPEGYTWHHHEQPGQLQLVETAVHDQTAHTGGRFIWGGGSEYR